MKFSDLVEKLGEAASCNSLGLNGACNPEISGLAAVDEATPSTLTYVEGVNYANRVGKTEASALILPPDEALQAQAQERGMAWIATSNPRLLFAQTIALFYQPFRPPAAIHPTAVIHPSTQLGKEVYIGAHVVIEAGVKIGDGVCIYPNVVIYPQAQIGDRTVLHANCTIHERSQIGADCMIHSGAVIGSEGFGFVLTPSGWVKMEQSGYTVLEDRVEIGCNSAIDRPAVGETRIGYNTKIDNMVQIGHSCQVGQNCLMAGQVGVAGSCEIGNFVTLAGKVGISNRVKMGDRSIATFGTVIFQDVEPGGVVGGYPAIPHKAFLKAAVTYRRLPEIDRSLKQVQHRIDETEST